MKETLSRRKINPNRDNGEGASLPWLPLSQITGGLQMCREFNGRGGAWVWDAGESHSLTETFKW